MKNEIIAVDPGKFSFDCKKEQQQKKKKKNAEICMDKSFFVDITTCNLTYVLEDRLDSHSIHLMCENSLKELYYVIRWILMWTCTKMIFIKWNCVFVLPSKRTKVQKGKSKIKLGRRFA